MTQVPSGQMPLKTIDASGTSTMRNQAEKLRKSGANIANLAAGELDFSPPEEVLVALDRVSREGTNRYTETSGLLALREALSERIFRTGQVTYAAPEVSITVGAKSALYLACTATLSLGDEVLIPTPSWGTFAAQVRLLGAEPVPVKTNTHFYPSIDELERCLTSRTTMVVINTPNNPTGAIYPTALIFEILEWCRSRRLWVLYDESYAELALDSVPVSHPAAILPEVRNQLITIGSFSKTFAVTGWRVGYVYSSREVIRTISAIQSHTTSNAPSVLQAALVSSAANPDGRFHTRVRETLRHRRQKVSTALSSDDRIQFEMPSGGFYFFPSLENFLGMYIDGTKIRSIDQLCLILLQEGGVAVTPGSVFGAPNNFRISFALNDTELDHGLTQLMEVLNRVR